MNKRIAKFLKRGFLIFLGLVVLPFLLIATPVLSSDVRSAREVTIAADEIVNDDVYLSGELVRINGTVNGDAIVAGKEIIINGVVTGDVMAAGQSITINGKVDDDIRMAGQSIAITSQAQIDDDAMLAAWSLEQQAGGKIGGDLYFGGFQASLAGDVRQNVVAGLNSLELRGTVGKDVKATVLGDSNIFQWPFLPQPLREIPQIPLGLTIRDKAKIGGDLSYRSMQVGQISPGAQITGQMQFETIAAEQVPTAAKEQVNPLWTVVQQIQRLLALLLIGWLMLRWVPRWTQELATTIQEQPWPCLGWGTVGAIAVVPAAITILLVMVLFGSIFAVTLPIFMPSIIGCGFLADIVLCLGVFLIVAYLAPVVMSLLGGQRLMQWLRPTETRQIATLGLGLVIFVIFTALPVVGGILSLLAALFSLGALWLLLRQRGYRNATDRSLAST